jgi:HlyD family secretion protein
MDVARPVQASRKWIRRTIVAGAGLIAVATAVVGVSRLKPAAPLVEDAVIWRDTVKRGPMVRQVHGLGTMVPEEIRWIPAMTQARVERIVLRPGTAVSADTVILDLTNPQLDQAVLDAELRLQAAEAALVSLRVQIHNDLLQQRAVAADLEAAFAKARMQAQMNAELARDRLVAALALKQSQIDADQLETRAQIAREQLEDRTKSVDAQIAVQQSAVDQARAIVALRRHERDELRVRAGIAGMLQLVSVEVGQQVAPGANLARVADPARLKAEIKIAETQAKDIQIGQRAEIDTHNGVVEGRVTRIDPSVQNGTRTIEVTLRGALPRGAVPDLSVDGTIELERLPDLLFVGRPAFGQDQSVVGLFKVDAGGRGAARTQVRLGRSSVNVVEVTAGLNAGDEVILSDMSRWDAFTRIRLK